ncbi:C10 family peptidase [Prevotella sp. E9-3]|uniref:C10 family peptidase n=1 Tax=Prevotella sp. E9-3 TaxID=2913621 RepID=UPI001EDA2EB7|nr:C10 family peptidase [Prevotella sp. E9-3]UKK47969.1 C10 family peptidase [Prevotella sp. E9-3]
MKKSLFLLISLLLCQLTWADNVTKEEAIEKAQLFLNGRAPHNSAFRLRAPGVQPQLKLAKAEKHFYVFNVDNEEGFVVVSGNDQTPAILGYCDEGSFNTEEMPENMKAWLQGYADQLEWLEKHPNAAVKAPQLDNHEAIAPMLTTTWNQGAPYNNLCPLDNGERSLTGCVATAMAQVMAYHKYPARTKKTIPGYTTETKKISVSSIGMTTINWNNMQNNYTGSETSTQKTAVAKLMQLCGTSVKMDYTANSSGTFSEVVADAFKNYFDYDAATTLYYRDDFRAREWDNIIYNELANNRPVYYAGQSIGGGHAFVIDGYDKDGLYHVNWGWGGSSNNYFLLSILDSGNNSGAGASSSTDGYSFSQSALIGAQPNTGQPFEEEVVMSIRGIKAKTTTVTKSNGTFYLKVNADGVYNITGSTYTFNVGLGIFNENGELKYAEYNFDSEVQSGWGWNSLELEINVPALPDGTYEITAISREDGAQEWNRNKGGNLIFLTATIAGNEMTVSNSEIDLDGAIEVSGNMEVGSKLKSVTTFKNNGSFFHETLFLRVNGENVGAQNFEVNAGKSETMEMSFTPKSEGENELEVGYFTWNYNQNTGWEEVFHKTASTTITVLPAKSYTLKFSNGKVTNAVSNIINDNVAKLQVTVRNNGSNDYNDVIRTYILKEGDNNYYYSEGSIETALELETGKSKTITIDAPLTSNGKYWFIIVYKTNGNFIEIGDSQKRYGDLFGYTVTIPEEVSAISETMAEVKAKDKAIYSLSGQRVKKAQKGLYIIDGKKTIRL